MLKSHSKTTFHIVTAFLILPVHNGLVCDYDIPDYGVILPDILNLFIKKVTVGLQ